MKMFTALACVLVVGAGTGAAATSAERYSIPLAPVSQSTACWDPGPAGVSVVGRIREIVAATDAETAEMRDSVSLSVSVDTAMVQAVTDDSTCTRAVAAQAATYVPAVRAQITQVFVISVGPTRFVVWDGRSRAGEFDLLHVYDQNFNHLTAFTQ